MISPASLKIPVGANRRRTALLGLVGLLAMVAAACSVQETNAYPVDIFTEMHYAQSQRMQEPPRLQPPAQSVAHRAIGGPAITYAVPETNTRAYDPVVAGQLFAVNCAVCHGVNGDGNGPAAAHLTSNESYWATQNGSPYASPADLLGTRSNRTPEIWFTTVNNGINVMPAFAKLLKEEDIWDIIAYLFDEQTGLGTAQ